MKVVIHEYAPARARAIVKRWFPEAQVRRRYEGESRVDSFDLLILSGGPHSAHEQSRIEHPFLAEDYALLQELGTLGVSAPLVLGICLGAQLMAFAFGGKVVDQPKEETRVGWNQLNIVGQHPVFDGVASPLLQCEIHSNRIVTMPKNACLLVSSSLDEIEAFAVGGRFIGVGYHPEFIEEDLEWFQKNVELDISRFLCDTKLSFDDAHKASTRFFENLRSLV